MLSVLLLIGATLVHSRAAEPLTVSAAVSLTEALDEIAAAYRTSGGGPVRFNFGGSNVLARQIVNGAPVDVFISADDAQMDIVERSGLIAKGSRLPVAGNQLVVVAGDRAKGVASIQDLLDTSIRRVAIGDPAAVPAGVYARKFLENNGMWPRLEPKVVPSANVRAALAAVENGSVDAAIVYATDARIAPGLRVAMTIGGPDAPAIAYPACVIASTRQPAAAAQFVQFLRGPEAGRILERHGFLLPPARR
jgi:molybdate transport system substrate-binding protein